MTERATVFETVQIGPEPTNARGVPVAATRLLDALGIEAAPAFTSRRIRPHGRKIDTRVAPGRRSTEGSVPESSAVFGEVCYALESIFGVVTPTVPAGGTVARERLYSMNTRGPDTYRTYTVEQGSAAGAKRFAHALFTALTMGFTTEDVTVSGALIGQKPTRGITMTPNPVALPMVVMDPNDVLITADAAYANIGTTALERALSATFATGAKYNPLWVVNRNNPSWATVIESPVDATLGLVLEANTQSNQFLTRFEAGDVSYVRIEVLGPDVEAGQPHLFRADFAASVENLTEGDQDNVWADTWAFRLVDDPNIPGIRVLVRNGIAAL